MRWFGTSWGAPINQGPQMDVPFGACCQWCRELIDEDDSGVEYVNGPVAHRECFIRQAIGGVNHIEGRCTCLGGNDPPDPPDLTLREAARAAEEAFERKLRAS